MKQMAILIEEQDETINHVEKQAEATHTDLERGYVLPLSFYLAAHLPVQLINCSALPETEART